MRVAIVARGAISARGVGERAYAGAEIGAGPIVAIARDAELERAGLARPFAARARIDGEGDASKDDGIDRATALLKRALTDCARELDRVRPGWRTTRIGLILGTSSGGLRTMVRAFEAHDRGDAVDSGLARGATYAAPMIDTLSSLGVPLARVSLVLGACASSAIAIGIGARWVDDSSCDLVIAGGFDAVSPFVSAGFEALRAISPRGAPSPFRVGRDGMVLGEGAAVLALAHAEGNAALAFVSGFGASQDASHLTAPDRDGAGLARAAAGALDDANVSRVDLVSAHGTATELNDAAEARALRQTCTDDPPVFALKAELGHTLGAAGALETLACVDALRRGIVPATAGQGEHDDRARARIDSITNAQDVRVALKLASAFGGANAALVIARDARSAAMAANRVATRAVYVSRAAHVQTMQASTDLAALLGLAVERVARADNLSRLALASVGALARIVGRESLRGAGIVVGHGTATLETNAQYWSRALARGARFVEPKRFPYTSPNAASGECSIAFGLTGPGFACGLGGGVEALALAAQLVSSGDADRMVVVGVDYVDAMGRALGVAHETGACATIVLSSPEHAIARVGEVALAWSSPRAAVSSRRREASGHAGLAPLADPSRVPSEVRCETSWGLTASVALVPLSSAGVGAVAADSRRL